MLAFVAQGQAFAVSGTSLSGDAAQAGYPITPNAENGETLDLVQGRVQDTPQAGETSPVSAGGERAQASGGAAGGDERLPFTGFLAAGVLLAGVALLAGGYAVRPPRSA
jgi:hypothetical protein